MNTEPCPFCDGTGRRVVPPPPKPKGRPSDAIPGQRRHGYVATYSRGGCRCELCRAAWRVYQAERRRKGAA